MTRPTKLRARFPAVSGPLTVSRVDDDRHTGQPRREARVQMRIRVVSMNHVEAALTKQSHHLADLADAPRRLQQVNAASREANLIGKAADFANGEELGNALGRIVMPRDVGQDSFEPPRLQRQTDMTHAQRSRLQRERQARWSLDIVEHRDCHIVWFV